MIIKAMHRSGKSIRSIAKELGMHRGTVRKHLASTEFSRYRKIERKDTMPAPDAQTIKDFLEEDDVRATWIV